MLIQRSYVLFGVIVGIISSACQSVGLILQRKSHLDNQRNLWRIGFLLFVTSNILGSSIQLTTLPLIILSSLQSSGLVFNCVFNWLIMNEEFNRKSAISIASIIVGALILGVVGNIIPEPRFIGLKEFQQLIATRAFRQWYIFDMCVVLICLGLFSKRFYPGLSLGVVSGILSAFSVLLAKTIIQIFISELSFSLFRSVFGYIIVFFLLCFAQLVSLNQGLKIVSTAILYPLVFCIYNVTNIFNEIIFYQLFDHINFFVAISLVVGTSILIYGVAIQSSLNDQHQHSSLVTVQTPLLGKQQSDEESEYVSFGSPKGSTSFLNDHFKRNSVSIEDSFDYDDLLISSTPKISNTQRELLMELNSPKSPRSPKSSKKTRDFDSPIQ
ncbi:Hypothetical protein PP7435_CHR2-1528 [Komagataella phaffii CBS 7435]|uniref:Uncharacterized protein n=2 Tax=Komagataella phaffii TaxID=460519 RepID=C4R2M1_KOMPG|nr:Hypothetical protein PAS_chr2-2_0176 [Komagataella phaffii GS115]AOA63135.1 GQ67_01164T0 [Komagataella phaffii]CAH2447700.1 Hypothetical protein BQ9382_C2-1020 [Komagataella phaffii CBS 7435]AOA66996.1 GQ68_00225T0 [Komagataella phaffii GS115]CAY69745.1 Hypothetical protein PAS_chr2-2_0176 [Komagataella phaffii GS115]SCV11982.1 Hypothetical protein PP7435_CHR2-1528 [Komagataella phaffii CBS 7435]